MTWVSYLSSRMDLKENNYIACISKLHARLEDEEADIRSLLAFNFCSFGNVSLKIKLCIIYILIDSEL